MFDTLITIS